MHSRCRIRLIDGEIITRDIAVAHQDHNIFWSEYFCLQVICNWAEPDLTDPDAKICLLPESYFSESFVLHSHASHATYRPMDFSPTRLEKLLSHSTRGRREDKMSARRTGRQPGPSTEFDDSEQQDPSVPQHDMTGSRSTTPDTDHSESVHEMTAYEKHSYIMNVTKAYLDALDIKGSSIASRHRRHYR